MLKLRRHEVHLWMTLPDKIRQPELLSRYQRLLTREELNRQQDFVFEKKRHCALITRVFIRDLLSHYADVSPDCWRFIKGEFDKPEIVNPPLPLRFNLSHTDDLIICAVTLNSDIGCDVEMTGRQGEFLSIAQSYFSGCEYTALLDIPSTMQHSRFFDYWTLKESYIKACGEGLSIPLDEFSFDIGLAESPHVNGNIALHFSSARFDRPELWRSWLFYPDNGYRIAISVKAQDDIGEKIYSFRYFHSVPLLNTRELNCLVIGR